MFRDFAIYNSLAVYPGVARAFALRSCEVVARLHFPFKLRSTLSLYTCGSAQLPRFPDRPFNPQMTPSRNFILLLTCVRFKKKCRFRMVTYVPAGFPPGGSLPFCFSKSSRCLARTCSFASDVLHVSRRLRAVVPRFQPLAKACGLRTAALCWWSSVQTSSIVFLARKVKQSWSWAPWRKGKDLFSLEQAASFKGHDCCSDSVCGFRGKRAEVWDFLHPTGPRNTDRPTRGSLRKIVLF